MKNLVQYVGIRHLKLRPARTILTTLGVAFGIALYLAISIINRSTRESFRENVESVSGKSKITISAGPTGFAEEKLELVKATSGVVHAVPMIEARAYFQNAHQRDESIYILGVDLLQESAVRTYKTTDEKIIEDPLVFLNQPDSIVITKKFASERGLKIDSKLALATTEGSKIFTVRGLLEPEGAARAYGGSLAIMDIDGARVSFGKVGKVDRIDIIPAPGVALDALVTRLQTTLGGGFTVERPEEQSQSTERMIASYQMMITFFGSLALLVGLFLVFNSVSISVAERKREIGILRALGASRSGILSIFVLESTVMGFLGALIGSGLGRFLAELMVKQVTYSLSAQFHTNIQANHLELTLSQLLYTLALGAVTSSIAAFIPALRASRVSPLEAMKTSGLESTRQERGGMRGMVIGASLLIFVYFSMTFHWNQYWSPVEQLNQGASVLGAAFFGPFLVFVLIHGLRKIVRSKRTPIFRLAQDNLIRSRRRTATNVMALMVGLFLVMLIATVRASFQSTLNTWLAEILTADVIVTASGVTITADTQPIRAEIQDELLKISGVRNPGPGRGTRSRFLQFSSQGVKYTIKAFDEPGEYVQYRNFKIKGRDRIEAAKELFSETVNEKTPGIIVSENYFQKHLDQKPGGTMTLDTPSGRILFHIVAMSVDFASPNGVFYMSRKVYEKYWKDPLVTTFALTLEPGANLEAVRSTLASGVGKKYGLVALSNAEMRAEMRKAIDQSFAYTRAIEFAALFVALLGLLNTLLISILERTREIGVLRAIGSSKRQIFRMILTEAVIQGGFGAVVAVAIGAGVGKLWIENSLAHTLGWMVEFSAPVSSILFTIGVGILVSIIAGIYPSKRASELPVVEALEYE